MSSSDEEPEEYIPFNKRPEWNDITPIPQDDGPNPICRIAYTEQFSDVMSYFRAILQKDERSARALSLTDEVIRLNPANYTAWYFRRLLIEELKSDLRKELEFVSRVGRSSAKNYQIWHHRRWLIERLQDPSEELAYCAEHIQTDSKNYHTWAHRQWVIQTFNLWDNELSYIDSLLKSDMRNNSAWNQRYFIITKNRTQAVSNETRDAEIAYSFTWIKKAPNNQSPWTYVRGLFTDEKFSANPELKKTVLEFHQQLITSPHTASLLVDILEQEEGNDSKKQAIELCNQLETSLDTIHRKYWAYKKSKLESAMLK